MLQRVGFGFGCWPLLLAAGAPLTRAAWETPARGSGARPGAGAGAAGATAAALARAWAWSRACRHAALVCVALQWSSAHWEHVDAGLLPMHVGYRRRVPSAMRWHGQGCRRGPDVLAHKAVALHAMLGLLARDKLHVSTVLPRVWEIEERMIAGAALEDDILLISVRCGGSSITQRRLCWRVNLHAQRLLVVILKLYGRWFHSLALAKRVLHHGRGLVIAADEVDHDGAGRWAGCHVVLLSRQ